MITKKLIAAAGLTGTLLTIGLAAANTATVFAKSVPDENLNDMGMPPIHARFNHGPGMTMTSTDPTLATKIQAHKVPPGPKDENVTVTKTNIADGVQVTITSTDAATVKKIQQGSMRGGKGMRGMHELMKKKGFEKYKPLE